MRTITIKLSFTSLALSLTCAVLMGTLLTRGAHAQLATAKPVTPPPVGHWVYFPTNFGANHTDVENRADGQNVISFANRYKADAMVACPDIHMIAFHTFLPN